MNFLVVYNIGCFRIIIVFCGNIIDYYIVYLVIITIYIHTI